MTQYEMPVCRLHVVRSVSVPPKAGSGAWRSGPTAGLGSGGFAAMKSSFATRDAMARISRCGFTSLLPLAQASLK